MPFELSTRRPVSIPEALESPRPVSDSLRARLELAAADVAASQTALTDAADFVRMQAAHPLAAGIEHAADDPHILLQFGQLLARVHAAQGLLARARRQVEAASPVDEPARRNAVPAASHAEAAVAVIEAQAFARDVLIAIGSQVLAWGGSSIRELRPPKGQAHAAKDTSHSANPWSYQHVGSYHLAEREP